MTELSTLTHKLVNICSIELQARVLLVQSLRRDTKLRAVGGQRSALLAIVRIGRTPGSQTVGTLLICFGDKVHGDRCSVIPAKEAFAKLARRLHDPLVLGRPHRDLLVAHGVE